jgi:hypothetical protein
VEKLQYLVWLPETTARADVRRIMVDEVAPRLLGEDIHALTMDLDDADADVAPPLPCPEGEQTPHALVSLWLDCYDRRAGVEQLLGEASVRMHGYQVVESLYTDYGGNNWAPPRDWPDGERSPGILTVATFEQLPGTEFEQWVRFWHDRQSPMSEAIQPRSRYVRNLVVRALQTDAPLWRGIVEEAWPSAAHVTDPMLFYCARGDQEVLSANIATMLEHVTAMMDLRTMRSMTMSEWILKTLCS